MHQHNAETSSRPRNQLSPVMRISIAIENQETAKGVLIRSTALGQHPEFLLCQQSTDYSGSVSDFARLAYAVQGFLSESSDNLGRHPNELTPGSQEPSPELSLCLSSEASAQRSRRASRQD
jgi:hypothetical protein